MHVLFYLFLVELAQVMAKLNAPLGLISVPKGRNKYQFMSLQLVGQDNLSKGCCFVTNSL